MTFGNRITGPVWGGAIEWRDDPDRYGDWRLQIDSGEWWDCGGRGLALAVHVRAWDARATERRRLPDFYLISGAEDNSSTRQSDLKRVLVDKPPLRAKSVRPNDTAEGWLAIVLLRRYDGGLPGFVLLPRENEHNWRGLERLVMPITTRSKWPRSETRRIIDELEALARGGLATAGDEADHRRWVLGTIRYLRDRVSEIDAMRFEGAADQWLTLSDRLEQRRAILTQFVAEYQRRICSRA